MNSPHRLDLLKYLDEYNASILKKASQKCDHPNGIDGEFLMSEKPMTTSTPIKNKKSLQHKQETPKYSTEAINFNEMALTRVFVDMQCDRLRKVEEFRKQHINALVERDKKVAEDLKILVAKKFADIQAEHLAVEEKILLQLEEEQARAVQDRNLLEQEQQEQYAMRIRQRNERIALEERKAKEEEERKKQMALKQKHEKEMLKCRKQLQVTYQQISELVESHKAILPVVGQHFPSLRGILNDMEKLFQKCSEGTLNSTDVEAAQARVSELTKIYEDIKEHLVKYQNDEKKQTDTVPEPSPTTQDVQENVVNEGETNDKEVQGFSDCVHIDSWKTYKQLKEIQQNVEKSYDQLKTDAFKKYRFNCQKAVNVPINAICSTTAAHMHDKLRKLSRLISGQPVMISDNVQVSASQHPAGIAFCKDLLAKKFVLQGDGTVSSKPEAAFGIASIIVALWQEFPDLGELILAHFYDECPYLVPMVLPFVENETDEKYFKLLGYRCNKEDHNAFLKRMSGFMRLYSAILVSSPPRDRQYKPHPHGLSHGWRWLAALLNLRGEPRSDICATLIYCFLEVAGYSMHQHYGRQFQKVLVFLWKVYFPRLRKAGAAASGPISRLEGFLQKVIREGRIKPPAGFLPPSFW